MVSFNKKTILVIANILTPIICTVILGILSIGQGDYNEIFTPAGYESLIDPISYTFAIWGPIFLLLFVFLFYQLWCLFKKSNKESELKFIDQVSIYFIISTIMTSLWYIFWVYRIIWAATISMVLYLASLLIGYLRLKINLVERSKIEKIAIYVPWSMYTAWVTAATIVSITTFMVSIGFNNPPILPDAYWGVIVLLVALIVYAGVLLTRNDYVFAGVGIWTLFGIMAERLAASVIVWEIVITTIIGFIVLSAAIIYKVIRR
ncbi:MAG: hypothetical protein EU551_00290 [Promethearchaeota archaeon]|nr:MAG: hypothetical protein EU551_00290 [Candidatus Lokiarchaeota archaeon]